MTDMIEEVLRPDIWANLELNTLYCWMNDAGLYPKDISKADESYLPTDWIPDLLVVRTSSSSKRLEKGISEKSIRSPSSRTIKISDVECAGSKIGVILRPKKDQFVQSYFTPDGCLLLTGYDLDDAVVKDGYDFKTMRMYLIGKKNLDPKTNVHDCLVTAKKRWFRSRNDPKFLGFSKDK